MLRVGGAAFSARTLISVNKQWGITVIKSSIGVRLR